MLLRKATGRAITEAATEAQQHPIGNNHGDMFKARQRFFPKRLVHAHVNFVCVHIPPSVTSRHTVPTCSVRLRASAARRYHSQRQRSAGKNHIYFQTWKKAQVLHILLARSRTFFRGQPKPVKTVERQSLGPLKCSLLSCPLLLPVKKVLYNITHVFTLGVSTGCQSEIGRCQKSQQ